MFSKKCIATLIGSMVLFSAVSVKSQEFTEVYKNDFSKTDTSGWEMKNTTPEFAEDAEATSGKVMVIKSTNNKKTQMVKIPLDVEKLKGKRVLFKIRFKVEDLQVDSANQYAGAKGFFVYNRGDKQNRGGVAPKESTGWKEIEDKTPVLDDLTAANVYLGLQAATGVLKVDYVTISVK